MTRMKDIWPALSSCFVLHPMSQEHCPAYYHDVSFI